MVINLGGEIGRLSDHARTTGGNGEAEMRARGETHTALCQANGGGRHARGSGGGDPFECLSTKRLRQGQRVKLFNMRKALQGNPLPV